MAGFDTDRARELLAIPEDHEPVAVIALGYAGDPAALPGPLAEREIATRERRPLQESVHGAGWGEPLAAL